VLFTWATSRWNLIRESFQAYPKVPNYARVTEARNPFDVEYGPSRLVSLVVGRSNLCPEELVRACVDDVIAFSAGTPPFDDRTVMALRHVKKAQLE
jgi:hypothetical protein